MFFFLNWVKILQEVDWHQTLIKTPLQSEVSHQSPVCGEERAVAKRHCFRILVVSLSIVLKLLELGC